VVAQKLHYLYDSRKASERDPREKLVAAIRAIIVTTLIGGVMWFLLWKVMAQVLETR